MKSNDLNRVFTAIADSYYPETVTTSDATPVTVSSYTMTAAEMIDIEVICHAIGVDGGFVSRMARVFYYNGTMEQSEDWGYITKQYLGTALSTCDFGFDVSGDTVSVIWTGEAGKDITANFRIYINRMIDENALP